MRERVKVLTNIRSVANAHVIADLGSLVKALEGMSGTLVSVAKT